MLQGPNHPLTIRLPLEQPARSGSSKHVLKLTDQLTVIHGQTQILSEKLPAVLHEDLLTIRNAVLKGMEFNKRVLEAARECQLEVGI